MHLRAILFDLDGTIGNTLPVVLQALQETFRKYGGREYTGPEIVAMFGPSEEGVIRPRVPVPHFQAALQHYLDRYTALHAAAAEPFPGMLDLLASLKQAGVRLGIVTGKGRGTAEISMRAMGLVTYIEALETGIEAGVDKPQGMLRILSAWGVPAAQAAYVGDTPYDMEAAREAGLLPLGAAWAETATVIEGDGAARVFRTVAELADWVRAYSA